jgi:NAD(P)-dependent dehydrogenase (short-subunit alcohol dehydrogenase family)
MKTVLITGATSGIGKATAIELAKQGYTVIIHGRNKAKTLQVVEEIKSATANSKIDYIIADMFSMREVVKMAAALKQKYSGLDILINNAGGIMSKDRETTIDGFEKTMAINLFAPFLLTQLLLDLLKKGTNSRIINISSDAHGLTAKPDFNDLQLEKKYTPLLAYGNAKLFLIWISQHLASLLKQEGITVNSLHPGAVASNFGADSNLGGILNLFKKLAKPFFKTVEQGAETVVYLATSDELKQTSGKYFENKKLKKVNEKYYSAENEQLIWKYCIDKTAMA